MTYVFEIIKLSWERRKTQIDKNGQIKKMTQFSPHRKDLKNRGKYWNRRENYWNIEIGNQREKIDILYQSNE